MLVRNLRRLAAPCIAAIALLVLTGCGSSPVTRPRLERSLPVSFANQYLQQAKILGHNGLTVQSLKARAQCDKGGPKVADEGPGADWVCFMDWQDPNIPIPDGSAKFELNVRSNGCYTATGPTKLIGLRTITDTSGAFVDNPVFEFDTCFDPNGTNAPTGVTFPPAALVLPTGTVKPDAQGQISPALNCTVGPLGCSGSISARYGGKVLGTRHYTLAPGGASVVRFPAPPGIHGTVSLLARPTLGGAQETTTTLTVP